MTRTLMQLAAAAILLTAVAPACTADSQAEPPAKSTAAEAPVNDAQPASAGELHQQPSDADQTAGDGQTIAEAADQADQADESEETEVVVTTGVPLPRHHWDYTASLEEMIVKSRVIARVTLQSVEPAAAKMAYELTSQDGLVYAGSLKFTLNVLEYLKGTGGRQLVAYAYGYTDTRIDEWPDNGFTAETETEAIELARQLPQFRDTRWDGREAIVLLRYNEPEGHYYLGLLDAQDYAPYWDGFILQFTVASTMWKSWLPNAAPPDRGDTAGRSAGSLPHFLLDDPAGSALSGVPPATGSRGATARASVVPTIDLAQLRTKVKQLTREYNGGDGSAKYKQCVILKYEWETLVQHKTRDNGGTPIRSVRTHEIESGQPAGTVVYEPPPGRDVLIQKFVTPPPNAGEMWTEGRDSHLLVASTWPFRIETARPLPAGEYRAFRLGRWRSHMPCDAYPESVRERNEHVLTVTAPAGTLAESFFDPYASSTAITGTTTVGTISWQAGRVTADLDIDVAGHALDFIGLDGTTTLSLIVADATETDGTLTWTVPTQPWSAGDKLMLRVRRHDAPMPPSTPTPTPTPTPAPTPIPTDRPAILFLDILSPTTTVLESLTVAVGEVAWVTVRAENLDPSGGYTIEVTRVNDEPAGGVGIVFHNQVCYYSPLSREVSGRTSSARTMAIHLCSGTGGTVTAALKQGDTTLATADLEVSTPP